ncbi:ricin-type beta-trefoil lectin domain protein [Streptomyces sp. S3(2020)]|uniref:ricin-type beta-trefoil lectin domain protein n=1 Tax=Streptomyces sp. S3(2020) TaxID=2732044 RepID=UPI003216C2E0
MDDAALSPPTLVHLFGVADEQLAAELKKCSTKRPGHYPVGELLDRHWEAVFAYACLCASGTRAAGILTSAAFTRLFGESLRQAGPTEAWRPQLLVAVRRIAAEWDGDHRRKMLHPDLLSHSDGRSRAAARLLPLDQRRLLARAFRQLPEPGRCLLWHTEVDAEPLEIPAELLGMDMEEARVELDRAREQLRGGCVTAHRESASAEECRRYNRMLDVTFRRGGVDIDPDLRSHLARCAYCRLAAHELERFNGSLGLPLAEAVLGWGAREYLEGRPRRRGDVVEQEPAATAVTYPAERAPDPAPTDDRNTTSRAVTRQAQRDRRRRRNLALGVLMVSALTLSTVVLWSVLSDTDRTVESGTEPSDESAIDSSPGPGEQPSGIGGGDSSGALVGRLRNMESGLCVGIKGKEPVAGTEVGLTDCSSEASQQWSYEFDGLMRNLADPDLCLDSSLKYSIRLAPCTGVTDRKAKAVRYDFTLEGTVLPRWNSKLALAPVAAEGKSDLVLKTRDGGDTQRWTLDASQPSLELRSLSWGADGEARASLSPSKTPSPTTSPEPTVSVTPTSPAPSNSASAPAATVCSSYYECDSDGGYGDGDGRGGHHGGGRR